MGARIKSKSLMRSGRPGKPVDKSNGQTRKQISLEAARIMAEEGVRDFQAAKRKAIHRLNLPEAKNLPTNQEVDGDLREYLQLFHTDLAHTQQRLRLLAREAMHFLAEFEPRLVGAVLSGTVTKFSDIQLHICANTPEEVVFFLDTHRIPYEEADRRLRFGGDRVVSLPIFRFLADETAVEIYVFTPHAIREIPLSPIDGKPMHRANIKELESLIAVAK